MDLTIVAIYTICDDFLISRGHQDPPLTQMSDAEVMTTALVAARYFGGNQQTAAKDYEHNGYAMNTLTFTKRFMKLR